MFLFRRMLLLRRTSAPRSACLCRNRALRAFSLSRHFSFLARVRSMDLPVCAETVRGLKQGSDGAPAAVTEPITKTAARQEATILARFILEILRNVREPAAKGIETGGLRL